MEDFTLCLPLLKIVRVQGAYITLMDKQQKQPIIFIFYQMNIHLDLKKPTEGSLLSKFSVLKINRLVDQVSKKD